MSESPEFPIEKGNKGRFQPGHPGGPGRPKGMRNKLGEAFLKALHDDFEQNGIAAIQAARSDDPSSYIRVIAGLLPKEISGEEGGPVEVVFRWARRDAAT